MTTKTARNADEILARLHIVLAHLDGPNEDLTSKGVLLERIRYARAELRQIIDTRHPAA